MSSLTISITVRVHAGVEEPDERAAGLALDAEVVERQRHADERVDRRVDDVVGRDVREEAPYELLHAVRDLGGHAVAGLGREPVDEVDLPLFRRQCHEISCLAFSGG
jgi:hypothetical protein